MGCPVVSGSPDKRLPRSCWVVPCWVCCVAVVCLSLSRARHTEYARTAASAVVLGMVFRVSSRGCFGVDRLSGVPFVLGCPVLG